jgi:hypothetical protein
MPVVGNSSSHRLVVAALVLLVLVSGACKQKSEPTSAAIQHFRQPAQVSFTMNGHRNGSFKGKTNLEVLRGNGPEGVRLFVIGFAGAVPLTGSEHPAAKAELFVQLKDFHGNGTYQALPPGASGTAGTAKLPNDAYVVWQRPDDSGNPVEAYRYDKVAAPCSVKIENNGERGTATCEALSAADGIQVKMLLAWKASGKRVDLMPTTTTIKGG